jgi:hypothetical protein
MLGNGSPINSGKSIYSNVRWPLRILRIRQPADFYTSTSMFWTFKVCFTLRDCWSRMVFIPTQIYTEMPQLWVGSTLLYRNRKNTGFYAKLGG